MMTSKRFLDNFGRSETLWMYACSRCGECVDVCPVYEKTSDKYTAPGFKIKKMRGLITKKLAPFTGSPSKESVEKVVKGLYECTLCGRCWSVCPYNYDLVDLWEKARESAYENGLAPESLQQVEEAIVTEKNIFKRPHSRRLDWTKDLDVPVGEKADTVYFVGCLMSYRGQLKPAASALASILNAAGESWTILQDEVCCGVPLKFSGATKQLAALMDTNIRAIESTGARKIVFSCPGCYRMFWQEYSKVLGKRVRMMHEIELIDELVKSGKIKFKGKLQERMTYHDPCDLGRNSGIYDEPRELIKMIPGVEFAELENNREYTTCCGGGGNVESIDAELSANIASIKAKEIIATGADIGTTSCQQCIRTIATALKKEKSRIKAMDISQLVLDSINAGP